MNTDHIDQLTVDGVGQRTVMSDWHLGVRYSDVSQTQA